MTLEDVAGMGAAGATVAAAVLVGATGGALAAAVTLGAAVGAVVVGGAAS